MEEGEEGSKEVDGGTGKVGREQGSRHGGRRKEEIARTQA